MIKIRLFALILTLTMAFIGLEPTYAISASDIQQSVKSKSEIKHVLKKFAIAMAAVGGSGIILYLALRTYKRFREKEENIETCCIDIKKDLSTPETIEDATKLFIEKF